MEIMLMTQKRKALVSHGAARHAGRNSLAKQTLWTGLVAVILLLFAGTAFASGLGTAGDYSLFVFEDVTAANSEVRGRLAAGGNVSLTNYTVGVDLKDTSSLDTLVAGGNLTYTNGTIYGNAAVGGTSSLTGATVNSISAGSSIDFASAYDYLTSLSATLASITANGAAEFKWSGLYLTGDGSSSLQVFNISAADLTGTYYINLTGVPEGATVIINVSGTVISTNNLDSLQSIASNVLFNFYEAESLTLNGSLAGTILATSADITSSYGHIYGSVIAESWTGFMEIGYVPFEGTIPSVPEPATLVLLFSGLIGLAGVKRRRKQ